MRPLRSPRFCSEQRARTASAGFTLVEVLVAVSMAAIVLTAIYGVFTSVSAAKTRLDADGEVYHCARVIFDRLGREIRGAAPAGGPNGKGVFRGGRDERGYPFLELTTTAVAQQGEANTGIALIRYNLAEDQERPRSGTVLQRSERSALQTTSAASFSAGLRLATGITELQLRFFGDSEWREEWDAGQSGLPAMVELSLAMNDTEGRSHRFASAFELSSIAWK